jgi:hypothetical protein
MMPTSHLRRGVRLRRGLAFLWSVALLGLCSCQAQEPPLPKAAASFKKEVKETLARLTPPLIEPTARDSAADLNLTLQRLFSDPKNEGPLWPYKLVVTDKCGVTLALYPVGKGFGVDFSQYTIVQRVLQEKRILQVRLFAPNGHKVYIICAPLFQGDEVQGILGVALEAGAVDNKWGLSEPLFLALDFNR